jgi:Protein of unknown function (DUF4199)
MDPILRTGLTIGVLCGAWMFVLGATGWYLDPVLSALFFVVVLIEIGGLIWGLRKTAAEGKNYRGQLVAGTLMAVVAGVVIIVCSLIFTMVAFPDYAEARLALERASLQAQGTSQEEIATILSDREAALTPMSQALEGFMGTLVTGILASAVIAIFIRAKSPFHPSR